MSIMPATVFYIEESIEYNIMEPIKCFFCAATTKLVVKENALIRLFHKPFMSDVLRY
jgi:hypothetical protein